MTVDVVLVRPGVPGNVGAAARAVRNAGLDGLVLVAPGDWRTVECWRTAWCAQDVLERARVVPDLPTALGPYHYVVGFSSRREAGLPVLDVREMASELAALPRDHSAALVFGPETTGLTQEELARCGRRASIPSHPRQPSLNLSHAVMVASYEVFRARRPSTHAPRRASWDEKERLIELLRRALVGIEALPARNADGYFESWRALFQRADLTPRDVRRLEHMARKILEIAAERTGPAVDRRDRAVDRPAGATDRPATLGAKR